MLALAVMLRGVFGTGCPDNHAGPGSTLGNMMFVAEPCGSDGLTDGWITSPI